MLGGLILVLDTLPITFFSDGQRVTNAELCCMKEAPSECDVAGLIPEIRLNILSTTRVVGTLVKGEGKESKAILVCCRLLIRTFVSTISLVIPSMMSGKRDRSTHGPSPMLFEGFRENFRISKGVTTNQE